MAFTDHGGRDAAWNDRLRHTGSTPASAGGMRRRARKPSTSEASDEFSRNSDKILRISRSCPLVVAPGPRHIADDRSHENLHSRVGS